MNAETLNLKDTIESGQPLTFYSDFVHKSDWDILRYTTQRGVILISKSTLDNIIRLDYFGDYTSINAKKEVIARLGLDHDISQVYSSIKTDQYMEDAINKFYGMRITKNSPWETTLCFLISQFNNIKRIRLTMRNIIEKFGDPYYIDGKRINLFPTPERISKASISELMSCGTGFRAKYIKSVSNEIKNSFSFDHLEKLEYDEAKKELMTLEGVGDKVADCILLFGYKHYESFPIDVWIKRIIEKKYLNGKKKDQKYIHNFANKKWGPMAGYAQQYLYWYGRNITL
ncbi:MAG: DNA-3-methyladenine glycosylase 2 [Candidatus Micrarchaeia archaeon]